VRLPFPLLRGKKLKTSINLRNVENDALKVRSAKNSKSFLKCLRSLRLLLPPTQKTFNCTELLKSYLAGGNRIINLHRQTNRNRHNWHIWQNTRPALFISITSVFSYLCSKKQTRCTYIVCVAVWRLQSTTWGPRFNSLTRAVKISHTRTKHITWNAPKWS